MSYTLTIHRKEKDIEKWEGNEYVLCIIQALPDGTFIMKPGLSMLPADETDEDEDLKRLQEAGELPGATSTQLEEYKKLFGGNLLHQKQEQKFVFRTEDGNVYEYVIYLYNDEKKDRERERKRKQLLETLNERALIMRRNLVGSVFTKLAHDHQSRVHVFGKILSAKYVFFSY
jgi:hypothetical protein